MVDIYDATVLCDRCNIKTKKILVNKNGYNLRTLECPNCGKRWYHPADKVECENFEKLKKREFNVKLRMVGNSYTVSIPREIIDFEEEMNKEMQQHLNTMNQLVRLCLDEPGKLSLFFVKGKKPLKKIIVNEEK